MDYDERLFSLTLLNNIKKRKYMFVYVSLLYRGEEDNIRESQLKRIKNAILEK